MAVERAPSLARAGSCRPPENSSSRLVAVEENRQKEWKRKRDQWRSRSEFGSLKGGQNGGTDGARVQRLIVPSAFGPCMAAAKTASASATEETLYPFFSLSLCMWAICRSSNRWGAANFNDNENVVWVVWNGHYRRIINADNVDRTE